MEIKELGGQPRRHLHRSGAFDPLESSWRGFKIYRFCHFRNGDDRGPLYDVPVEINGTANFKLTMKKNPKTITTKRIFYSGNKTLDNELDGRPLVAYDEQSGDVVLVGFYSKAHENGVETHVAIRHHLAWIRQTLISRIFYIIVHKFLNIEIFQQIFKYKE
uniref:Peptidase S1 domain-containing protein n=1 Tax=Romanomermis culicivorax TaxID=13658 RepID=A0A915HTG1_ROMCU